ncbi:hypothetical protein FRC10_003487 [Ceratobasidium sp. 414]|nr:hypothetical protein FRC10_003487 [Ceratobasidium sp. 414]
MLLSQVPPELTPILPFLQQAEEIRSKDPVISYWCGYHAAQEGLRLKLSTHEAHSFLFQLVDSLLVTKEALCSHKAINDGNLGYLYVEKYADDMFLLAEAEDRHGTTSRSTANQFLAAGYCFDALSVFEGAKQIQCPNINEKRTYAYWRAGEIRKLLENNRTSLPSPSTSMDILPLPASNMMHPNNSRMPAASSISQLPPIETSPRPLSMFRNPNATPYRSTTFQSPATVPDQAAIMSPGASEQPTPLVLPPRRVRFSDSILDGLCNAVYASPPSYPELVPTDPLPLSDAFVQPQPGQASYGIKASGGAYPSTNGSSFELASSRMVSAKRSYNAKLDHLTSQLNFARECFVAVAGGGFGDIYRGKLRDGTVVAIKALRHHILIQDTAPKALKRATRELYTWSKAKHKNVQELLGVIMFQGQLGMVSPWMDNGNLEEYIQKNPGVDRHDLRNVLVDKDGIARLSDFDHSILSNCTLLFTETTNVGGGTLRWMAPELLLSSGEDDAAPITRSKQTDIYALGMTMLEIISGRVPYVEYKVDRGIIRALDRKEFPTRPREVSSDWIWSLLEACWNHDPEARPSASWVYDQVGVNSHEAVHHDLTQATN